MRLAFCTTCKGRLQHIQQTLLQNIADNPEALFILVDYDSDDGLEEWARAHAHERLVVYRYRNGGAPFHVAHAKNLAARCAIREGADLLVTLDADNFTGPGFAAHLASRFAVPAPWPGIFLVPDHLGIQKLPHGPGRPCRGFAGRLACWARAFVNAGGYDEAYNTWRGEDIDMNFRLERMGYQRQFIDNQYLGVIPHGADVRFKEYPEARQYENENETKAIRARTNTVVNFGNWGVATVDRNYETPVTLAPLPTRVFGIGLHKTGTTSLHKAFKILGLDSFHWGQGEAPMIWQEMQALGRSKTLEQHYALSDLPIPLLYQELDRAYPGSKFILTIRDEVDWLMSVKRLWDPKYNPTRHLWEVYPFSHHIHSICYGQREFEPVRFLERYRRHNAEVRKYFKHRPEDLLVLDMDRDAHWPKLCQFLGKAVPVSPYPRANGTTTDSTTLEFLP